MKSIFKIFRDARDAKKLSREKFGTLCGFSREHVFAVESGKRLPKGPRLRAYVLASGLSLKDVENPIKEMLWKKQIK